MGGFYGWPYAYIGPHAQPDVPARPDLVAKANGHAAKTGMTLSAITEPGGVHSQTP